MKCRSVVTHCYQAKCGLTIPSSGRAYGTPLKSNVRPRFRLHHESPSAVRCATHGFVQNTGSRGHFEIGALSIRRAARAVARVTGCHGRILSCSPSRGHSQRWLALSGLRPRQHRSVCRWRIPAAPIFSPWLQRQSASSHTPLVCFATQIQSRVASPRAWPNPSFKRTCLRHAA